MKNKETADAVLKAMREICRRRGQSERPLASSGVRPSCGR